MLSDRRHSQFRSYCQCDIGKTYLNISNAFFYRCCY
ncbi:hypothetical protein MGSAQ_000952 [marine sediment metagenome]|uniref:Uncharacterized protein n=1 Tax=marine sediment metagenome TaxID=412755 RepID=A0A1B6NW11_9ZZZZ